MDPEGVSAEEAQLVRGAMTLASKLVVDVMLPLEDVFCLPAANPVDRPTLETLVQRGFSRVPLFEGAKPQLVSYVIVKELLTVGFSVLLFGDRLSPANCLGLLLCVSGIAGYQRLKAREKE